MVAKDQNGGKRPKIRIKCLSTILKCFTCHKISKIS